MENYYFELKSFWRHNRSGIVYMLYLIDDRIQDVGLMLGDGRTIAVPFACVANLYSEISETRARRLTAEADKHGWDKAPSKPIQVRPLVEMEFAGVEPLQKRPAGRPRKVDIVLPFRLERKINT